MKKYVFAALAAAVVALTAPALAQQAAGGGGGDLWSHQINTATAGTWNLQPNRPRPTFVTDPNVPGGGGSALRVRVTAKGANPWDMQVSSPIAGAIKRGDVVLFMYYARAETPAEGGSVLPTRIQINAAPYTAVLESTEHVTGAWAQHCAYATAAADFAASSTNISVHLATAPQVIDFGPVFVFDLGPNFDTSTLPNCNND